MINHHYKVTFKERGIDREIHRDCYVPSREEVIRIYGLEEPDIESYTIEEVED